MSFSERQPESPRRRRRWFQYTLRTLLLVMLLASIGMSWVAVRMQQARRQREAVRQIRERHGEAHYDYQGDKYDVLQPGPREPSWFSHLFGEDFCHKVRWAELYADTTDADLARIVEQLPRLRRIDLNFSRVTDAGLNHVSPLTQLEGLELDYTRVSDSGLQHLRPLRCLRV